MKLIEVQYHRRLWQTSQIRKIHLKKTFTHPIEFKALSAYVFTSENVIYGTPKLESFGILNKCANPTTYSIYHQGFRNLSL